MSNTIKNISNLLSTGQIPVGCTSTCRLEIPNLPPALTQAWNDCLRQCGKLTTGILIDYHSQRHKKLLTEIQSQIQKEFDNILCTYNNQIPKSKTLGRMLMRKSPTVGSDAITLNMTLHQQKI